MTVAIYARFSSENQRPESIEDQVRSCRRVADERGWVVLEDHIYADAAVSGASWERRGLDRLCQAARDSLFQGVLVEDLSRLARDNFLMLRLMFDLQFQGIRVVSVADGVDTADPHSALMVQFRGVFNELFLRDLRAKTLRGQIGQKRRGFFVGEGTFGYRSVPIGAVRCDKAGRARPEGFHMQVHPDEAEVVRRIFQLYADGASASAIACILNADAVPGRFRSSKGWSPGSVTRILDQEKYTGHWVWNKTGCRRDPRNGKRRFYQKPDSEWEVLDDESLRIVPHELWQRVRARRAQVRGVWPGGKGNRGFSPGQGGRVELFPDHLLSGAMYCGCCDRGVGLVSGRHGGYYGCTAARNRGCDNRVMLRRIVAEKIIVEAVQKHLADPRAIRYVFERLEQEVAELFSDVPDTIRRKKAQLGDERRRLGNLVDFIAEGRHSSTVRDRLAQTEAKVSDLESQVEALSRGSRGFHVPSVRSIEQRCANLRELLDSGLPQSALVLRAVLGPIRLDPVTPVSGRRYYRARTTFNTLKLLEDPDPDGGADPGATSIVWWAVQESNL